MTQESTSVPRKLNVFFDVDNTLIMWNGTLRAHTREVFERILEAGHTIYIWSGVGIRRWDMKRHELDQFVTDYYVKPLEKHHESLEGLGVPMVPDFVIDDHRTVVDAFGGYHIPDEAGPDDTALLDVFECITAFACADANTVMKPGFIAAAGRTPAAP